MYDHLICELPLDAPVDSWQTRDTPEQGMLPYLLDRKGVLRLGGKRVDFTGDLRFYGNEIVEQPDGVVIDDLTRWWEYKATFRNGTLADLALIHAGDAPWARFESRPNGVASNGSTCSVEVIRGPAPAIRLVDQDGYPVIAATVDVPGAGPDEVYVRNPGLVDALVDAGAVEKPSSWVALAGKPKAARCRLR